MDEFATSGITSIKTCKYPICSLIMKCVDQEERTEKFTAAMHQYGAYVIKYLRKMTPDAHLAEEVAQNLWVYVHLNYSEEDFGNVRLLLTKAKYLLYDEFRKLKTRSFVQYTDSVPDESEHFSAGANSQVEEDFCEVFWTQFKELSLTEKQRKAFWLHVRCGYTLREVAAIMKVSVPTVHEKITRVKQLCLNHLNTYESI